jgi:hypothetical protein
VPGGEELYERRVRVVRIEELIQHMVVCTEGPRTLQQLRDPQPQEIGGRVHQPRPRPSHIISSAHARDPCLHTTQRRRLSPDGARATTTML